MSNRFGTTDQRKFIERSASEFQENSKTKKILSTSRSKSHLPANKSIASVAGSETWLFSGCSSNPLKLASNCFFRSVTSASSLLYCSASSFLASAREILLGFFFWRESSSWSRSNWEKRVDQVLKFRCRDSDWFVRVDPLTRTKFPIYRSTYLLTKSGSDVKCLLRASLLASFSAALLSLYKHIHGHEYHVRGLTMTLPNCLVLICLKSSSSSSSILSTLGTLGSLEVLGDSGCLKISCKRGDLGTSLTGTAVLDVLCDTSMTGFWSDARGDGDLAGLVPDWSPVSRGEVTIPWSALGVRVLGLSVPGEFFTGVRGDCLPVPEDTGGVFILMASGWVWVALPSINEAD